MERLEDFIKISKYAGMREDMVQAGGGNSAYKISEERMVIKASGYQLADVSEKNGYAIVNPRIIKEAFLEHSNLDDITEEVSKSILEKAFIEGGRPSIETFLHSISGSFSLHTHPITVNALVCRADARNEILKLFSKAMIVPYATPGVELAKVYFKEYKDYRNRYNEEPQIIFLMNHGLVISANTADKIIELAEFVTLRIEEYLHMDNSAYHCITKLNELYKDGIIWKVTDANVLSAKERLGNIWQHCFCPDSVVFLGKKMYEIRGGDIVAEDYYAFVKNNEIPTIISFKGSLYIHAESVRKALEIQSVLSFNAQVMVLNEQTEVNFLTEREKDFLLNWDAEKYRRNLK